MVCVYIRCCGHGRYWFRSYSRSLLNSRNAGPVKSKQNALAPPLGTSLRLGVPSAPVLLRGPPRGLTGRLRSRSKATAQRPTGRLEWFVGASLLAKVVNDDVGILNERGVLGFFAGKPAPTEKQLCFRSGSGPCF